MATENLLTEFPPVSTGEWEAVIARDLKGADYAKRLVSRTDEGLAVRPYYRAEDTAGIEYVDAAPGDFPYARGARSIGDWRIREEIDETNPEQANRAAQTAIADGAEEIAFSDVFVSNASDLGMLLANLQEVPVHFECVTEPLLRLLIERLSQRQALSEVSTGFDPLADLDFASEALQLAPSGLTPFTIHGEKFEEAGATAVEEVAFALAAGIDFLAAMQDRKIDVNRAATSVTFSFAIGADFFFQIAKLRAFRILWARAVESFGGAHESAATRIHARTSRWNETVYDPHVNILRGTTEAMSAILGGADSVSVAPFDECYKMPDAASRRLARNTQILLKQEALLSRVADPGAGSYCIETFTDFISREGWKRMQTIEAAGGYLKAVTDAVLVRALGESLAAKERAVASRRRVFTGSNQYANATEKVLSGIDLSRLNARPRATRSFEELRLRTERHAVVTGKTPCVLMAEFGDVKMRSARSSFATNFFACAGFELVTKRFANADEIAASDADLIVLCSSDPEYLSLATNVIAKLKELGRETPVIIAGNPESAEELRAAGVADFIHIRSNPIELLTAWQQRLGIKD